jgi:hypothetical protein
MGNGRIVTQRAISTPMLSALVLALAAAPIKPPERGEMQNVVRDQCLLQAADPRNPWALAHGITALGATYLASDGRKASEVIVHDFLARNQLADGGAGPGSPFGFVRYAPDGTPVEPHYNLITKTFVRAGLPLTTKFAARWGPVTLADLVASVKKGFLHVPASEPYWEDVGWTLDLISATSKPGDSFVGADGKPVKVDPLFDDALAYLERADQELDEGLKKGLPEVPKRKQGIYAHSCGGLHLVQAVISWARFDEVKKRWGARYERQLQIVFYRLDSERRQYEAALQQAPQYKLQILVQMLKFYGHFLETVGRAKAEAGFKPTEAQVVSINTARALLDNAIRQLVALKAFNSMESLRSSQPQVALDLIGDSCHASHGWDYWP